MTLVKHVFVIYCLSMEIIAHGAFLRIAITEDLEFPVTLGRAYM